MPTAETVTRLLCVFTVGPRLLWFPPLPRTGPPALPAPLRLQRLHRPPRLPHPTSGGANVSGVLGTHATVSTFLSGSSLSSQGSAVSQDGASLSPAHHPLQNKHHHPAAEGLRDPGHTPSRSFMQRMKTKRSWRPQPRQAQTWPLSHGSLGQ